MSAPGSIGGHPTGSVRAALLIGVLAVIGVVHLGLDRVGEPFFNSDETRHVMTGVFFRDAYCDLPVTHPVSYTTRYFLQYPALGLLVWPPMFYAIEGLAMLAFGTSFLVAKVLVVAFAFLAVGYLFLIVEKTHGARTAALAGLVFGLAPLAYRYSAVVMLEMPCLAFALGAIHHFLAYLDGGRRRDLWLAALASSASALSRFDAVYLLVFFSMVLVSRKRLELVRKREVWLAAAVALVLVLPSYAISAHQFGATIRYGAFTGTRTEDHGFLAASSLVFYPSQLPSQLGWPAFGLALVGLVAGLSPSRRGRSWPFLAMIGATYLTFTPFGEVETRHAIYWVPAFALFAVEGLEWLVARSGRPGLLVPLSVAFVATLIGADARDPGPYITGYEAAAQYVLGHSGDDRVSLFDGDFVGGYVFQIRRHDPARRHWVLRGDKLLYNKLITPKIAYVEYAKDAGEILATLRRHDPALIVVEEPDRRDMPLADLLRATLNAHPELYRVEAKVPIEAVHISELPTELVVYRSLVRNPHPDRSLDVPMLGLGRSLRATIPGPTSGP